jgi:hypothetical protein
MVDISAAQIKALTALSDPERGYAIDNLHLATGLSAKGQKRTLGRPQAGLKMPYKAWLSLHSVHIANI